MSRESEKIRKIQNALSTDTREQDLKVVVQQKSFKIEENREAHLNALREKLRAKGDHAKKVLQLFIYK
jgi:hypothetical protein